MKGTASELFYLLDEKDTVWKVLTKVTNHAVSLQSTLDQCQRDHSHVLSEETITPEAQGPQAATEDIDDINSIDSLSNEFSRVRLGVPKKIHYGESSHMMLVMKALEHRKKLDSSLEGWQSLLKTYKREEFWNVPTWLSLPEPELPVFKFPDSSEMRELVNAYFDQVNVYCPLLHRPSFERSVSQDLHARDSAFGALLLAVCAVGSRYAYPPSEDQDSSKSGILWFTQLPIKQSAFGHSVSLYHLQMYCLAGTYLNIVIGPDIGWMLSGIALRLAQERGTHRRTLGEQKPTLEGELWKRVYWVLVAMDSETSTVFGRPSATSMQDFDLEFPIECDDEYWEAKDESQAFVQPAGQPSLVSFWSCYLKLVEIIGFAQQTLYPIRRSDFSIRMGISGRDWYQKAVMELDSTLNKWIDSVPQHLRWDAQPQSDLFFGQSAILHAMYYWVQIQVHRRFIPRPGQSSQLSFPSLAICANAARSCIRVVESYLKRRFLAYGHFMYPLFGSAMVLAVNLWRERQINSNSSLRNELTDIYKSIEMIRLYETRYVLAGRLIDIINTVISVSHYPPLLVSEPQISNYPTLWQNPETFQQRPEPESSSNEGVGFQEHEPGGWPVDGGQNMNLPFYSSELGQLPIHTPTGLGYNINGVTNEELAIFDSSSQSELAKFFPSSFSSYDLNQDELSFMTGTSTLSVPTEGHLYNLAERSVIDPATGSEVQDWDTLMTNVNRLLPTLNTSEKQGPWMSV
ncbi:Gypsy retrotransposon integrase-like protein 1 [Stygiomarasmius scandens]|uniref:Gypsy retrotransposon integrase-like protein 1 n=1 Tax=Marasmiellus scandens TaxID=2682957 RepID=A0ABR1ISU7_9AGAR